MNLFNRQPIGTNENTNDLSSYTPRVDDGFDYDKAYNQTKSIQYDSGQRPNDITNSNVRFMLYHNRYGYIGFSNHLPSYEYDNKDNAAIFSYKSARYYQVDVQDSEITIMRLDNINQYTHHINTDKILSDELAIANNQAQVAQKTTAQAMSKYAGEIDVLNQSALNFTLDLSDLKPKKESSISK